MQYISYNMPAVVLCFVIFWLYHKFQEDSYGTISYTYQGYFMGLLPDTLNWGLRMRRVC